MKVFLHPPSLCPHHTRCVPSLLQIEMQKELDSELHRQRLHRARIIIAHLIMMWLDIMIPPCPTPLSTRRRRPPSAMRAAAASRGTRGIPHGFPLCTMDHNHPESSQLKLGGRSPFGLQHRINMLFRGKEAPSGVGEKSPPPYPLPKNLAIEFYR